VVHNQDNREHDLLDSDDYYQFEGGLAATVETSAARRRRSITTTIPAPNGRWCARFRKRSAASCAAASSTRNGSRACMRHGYKGAFEMAATLDYLFAFAATTHAVRDHHFDQLYEAYLDDEVVRDFLQDANPAGYQEMLAGSRRRLTAACGRRAAIRPMLH
jgi:cobaltochelatase CobN